MLAAPILAKALRVPPFLSLLFLLLLLLLLIFMYLFVEHLLPLHVVAGAAHGSKTGGKEIYSLIFGTSALNCYLFE